VTCGRFFVHCQQKLFLGSFSSFGKVSQKFSINLISINHHRMEWTNEWKALLMTSSVVRWTEKGRTCSSVEIMEIVLCERCQ